MSATVPPAPLEILVVDYEARQRGALVGLLRSLPGVGEVHEAASAEAVLRALSNFTIDVVLLEIGSSGPGGMELARVLARFAEPPAVVFLTPQEDYAADSFEVQAVDYVWPPITAERLGMALERAAEQLGRDGDEDGERNGLDRLVVETGGKTRLVTRSEVVMVESCGDYCRLHTISGHHLVRTPLATLEAAWEPHGFLRVHRSYLVSIDAIEEVTSESSRAYRVRVAGRELPVSRRHARVFRERVLRPPADA